jgi:inorganic pyrophosphatase
MQLMELQRSCATRVPLCDMAHLKLLSQLPVFDDDGLRAVVETPKGSPNKYDYNPDYGCFELAKTLPQGMTFPFDFGFIPSTKGEDGDSLDILVLMDFPAVTGCVVSVRLLGCIKAEQKEKGEKPLRNDRFIAVAKDSRTLSDVKVLADLRSGLLHEIKEFFIQYNRLANKKFTPIGDCDAKAALALVKAGAKTFAKEK